METPPDYLPMQPGIYQFLDNKGQSLYIGKAKNIAKRVAHYFTPGSLWKQEMVREAANITYIQTPTEEDALLLEENLIKQHLPEYNKLLRNNSNYVFLKISKGIFPSFMIVRKRINDGSRYVGPRYRSTQLWLMLRYLRHVFKFHTMKPREFAKGTLSTDYFFGLDRGWSVIAQMTDPKKTALVKQALKQGLVLEKSFEDYLIEYQKITTLIHDCFAGKTTSVLKILKQHIDEAITQEHFERCAKLRDLYQFIETLDQTYQHIMLTKPLAGYFGTIQSIGKYRIIILLHLMEGKVVDILREKKLQEEFDLSNLEASIVAEFETTHHFRKDDNVLLMGSSVLKNISTKERTTLEQLLQTSLESFITQSSQFSEENVLNELLIELKDTYQLTRIPYEIDCIDISHLAGDETSGGLASFVGGVPAKKRYRHYKIRSIPKGKSDDYQALKELIIRRFKLTKNGIGAEFLPDLLVIDGGKGQLGILRELMHDYPSIHKLMTRIDIVALGKGEARQRAGKRDGAYEIIYQFDTEWNITETPMSYGHADHILIKIRDEAHRFANRYRKMQGEKKWRK